MEYFKNLENELKKAGLEEGKVEEIVTYSKKQVPLEFRTKVDYKKLESEHEAFKETAKEKDDLIKTLETKSESVEEYDKKIKELNLKLEKTESEFQEKLKAKTLESKVNEKISLMKDLNPKAKKAFKKLLDYESISLEGEELKGFEEQATSIKTENDYMIIKSDFGNNDPENGGEKPKSNDDMTAEEILAARVKEYGQNKK